MTAIARVPVPAARAWAMVAVLCLLAAISYLDRYIVALLATPIMRDLGLTPSGVGLLMGVGFGLLYALASVPLANGIDRGHRVWIVAAGVAVWSLATVASAFAASFGLLLVTRAGVAIGEAVLVPAAVSLVADLFAPGRRALPIGAFMAVSTLMGTGSFLIGGWILDWAQHGAVPLAPWRTTLLTIGLVGLMSVALWLLTAREPARAAREEATVRATFAETLAHVRERRRFFAPLYPFAVSAVASYGFLSWIVTVLVESHGIDSAEAGRRFGSIGLVAGAIAAVAWPWLGGRMIAAKRQGAAVALIGAGLLLGHAAVAAVLVTPTLYATLAAVAIAVFGHGAAAGLAVLAIQSVAPQAMRARLVAFYMLAGNFAGLVFGPLLPGWMAESLLAGSGGLRSSLGTIALTAGPIAAILLAVAGRNAPRLN